MRPRALLMSVQSAPRSGVRSGSISRRFDSAELPCRDGRPLQSASAQVC
jgi:hypothetical protein